MVFRARRLLLLIAALLCLFSSSNAASSLSFEIEDIYVPENCEVIAKPSDHLLIEYVATFSNGTEINKIVKPAPLFHIHLLEAIDMPIYRGLKGMCKNSTRKLSWENSYGVNFAPIFASDTGSHYALTSQRVELSIEITINHITEAKDYRIFDLLKTKSVTSVLDVIEERQGVNAVDEYEQTPLMIATMRELLPVVAYLLNTRRPSVDINMAKSVKQSFL